MPTEESQPGLRQWVVQLLARVVDPDRAAGPPPPEPAADASPPPKAGIRAIIARAWPVVRTVWPWFLAVWFAWFSYGRISGFVVHGYPLGLDATIYYRGAAAWLSGGDPWAAGVEVGAKVYHYAGTPVTTILLAPGALLGEQAFTYGWLALTLAAAIYIVRRLRLPWFWLLFPPLTEGMFSGNPQIVVLALLLMGWAPASALATMLKVYAFAPLVGEWKWRHIIVAVAANAATFAIGPGLWFDYLRRYSSIAAQLSSDAAGGWSAYHVRWLFVILVIALGLMFLRNRRIAGWLAVPAIWPDSQFHYSTMAMPVMTPLLAVLLAVPQVPLPAIAVLLEIVRRLLTPHFNRLMRPRLLAWYRG